MLEIAQAKDLQDLWTKVEELRERTKRHTKQIIELQKEVKK
jgi:hypothetical protein